MKQPASNLLEKVGLLEFLTMNWHSFTVFYSGSAQEVWKLVLKVSLGFLFSLGQRFLNCRRKKKLRCLSFLTFSVWCVKNSLYAILFNLRELLYNCWSFLLKFQLQVLQTDVHNHDVSVFIQLLTQNIRQNLQFINPSTKNKTKLHKNFKTTNQLKNIDYWYWNTELIYPLPVVSEMWLMLWMIGLLYISRKPL